MVFTGCSIDMPVDEEFRFFCFLRLLLFCTILLFFGSSSGSTSCIVEELVCWELTFACSTSSNFSRSFVSLSAKMFRVRFLFSDSVERGSVIFVELQLLALLYSEVGLVSRVEVTGSCTFDVNAWWMGFEISSDGLLAVNDVG